MTQQSDTTIQSRGKYITPYRVNQVTRTSEEIDRDFKLLKTYYERERFYAEKRLNLAKDLVYDLYFLKHWKPTRIINETGISRKTVYEYLKKRGGDSR